MEVLLLYPPKCSGFDNPADLRNQTVIPPYGLAYLTTCLRGHGIKTAQDDLQIRSHYDNLFGPRGKRVDIALFKDEPRVKRFLGGQPDDDLEDAAEKILKKIQWKGFDVYGFSLNNHESDFSLIGSSLVLAKLLKERTSAKVVAGGYCTELLRFQEDYPFFDYALFGPGHMGFVDYLKREFEGEVADPGSKPRTIRVQGNFRQTTEGFFFPDYRGLPMELYAKPYFDNGLRQDLVLPYKFVKGCLFSCFFCSDSLNPRCDALPVDMVVREISELSRRWRARNFMFLNSNFNPTLGYARELVDAIQREGLDIRFSDSMNLKFTDRRLLAGMRDAGATRLIFGVESGSPKVLSYIGKPLTASYAEKRVKLLYDLGIWSCLQLIVGFPHETEEDVQRTIGLVERVGKHVCHFFLNRFRVYRDTQAWAFPERYGLTSIQENHDAATKQPYPYRYSEAGGLAWEEKVRQIEGSYIRVAATIERRNRQTDVNLNMLFPLYEEYGSRERIEGVVARAAGQWTMCHGTPGSGC